MMWAPPALQQALTGVAALHDPATTPPANLRLLTTFAGFDGRGMPVLKQLRFEASWSPSGPLSTPAPAYNVYQGELVVEKFTPLTVGITSVADAILQGAYSSEDPAIRDYYEKRRQGVLDNLSLEEMKTLAKVILHETRNFTNLVGGEDQIAMLPVNGDSQWFLPTLPSDSELPARFFLWKGIQ
jgi:hypothetical protein